MCSIPTKHLFSRMSLKRTKKPEPAASIPAPIISSSPLSYEPFIHDDEIRLLVIHAGQFDDLVRCELVHARLNEDPAYDALSYAWGEKQNTDDVVVNGCRYRVGRNLFLALKHLRLEGEERRIWIDALCINQKDDKERGHQVSQMGVIYSHAVLVRIWLGPSNELTEATFSIINRMLDTEQQALRFDDDTKKHFVNLCARPYWGRLWIIQEIVKAAGIVIHCGSLDIPWDTFTAVVYENPDALDKIRNSGVSQLCRQRLAARPKSWDQRSPHSLMALMHIHIRASCADVRDKVYGLHSFAPSCCRIAIPVDYSCSAYELCGRILIHETLAHGPNPASVVARAAQLHRILIGGCLRQQDSNMAFDVGSWETSLSKSSHKSITSSAAVVYYGIVEWSSPPLSQFWSNAQDFQVPVDLIHLIGTAVLSQDYSMDKLAKSHSSLTTIGTNAGSRTNLDETVIPMISLSKDGDPTEDTDSATTTLRNFLLSAQTHISVLKDFYLVLARLGEDAYLLHSPVRAQVGDEIQGYTYAPNITSLPTMVEEETSNILGTAAFFLGRRPNGDVSQKSTSYITIPHALAISQAVSSFRTVLQGRAAAAAAAEVDATPTPRDSIDDQITASMIQPTKTLSRNGFSLAFAEEPARDNQEQHKVDATKAAQSWGSNRLEQRPDRVTPDWNPSREAYGWMVAEKYGQYSG